MTRKSKEVLSGRFVVRVGQKLHSQLVKHAKEQGISLNLAVVTFLAEGLGRHHGSKDKGDKG